MRSQAPQNAFCCYMSFRHYCGWQGHIGGRHTILHSGYIMGPTRVLQAQPEILTMASGSQPTIVPVLS